MRVQSYKEIVTFSKLTKAYLLNIFVSKIIGMNVKEVGHTDKLFHQNYYKSLKNIYVCERIY